MERVQRDGYEINVLERTVPGRRPILLDDLDLGHADLFCSLSESFNASCWLPLEVIQPTTCEGRESRDRVRV